MKSRGLVISLLLGVGSVDAEQYHLRDGTILSAGDVIVRGVDLVEGVDSESADAVVERTYPISEVVRLEWAEPEVLEVARAALAAGRGGEVAALLEPVRAEFVLFAKIPGSWWTAASLLRLRGLLDSGEAKEAEAAARELIATAINPEAVGLARLGLAELEAAAGQGDIATAMVNAITAEEDLPAGVQARAWVLRGGLALRRGEAETALEAYLRVVVLYGTHRDLLPAALAGSMRAYRLRGDPSRADRAAEELRRDYPESPETALIFTESSVRSPSL